MGRLEGALVVFGVLLWLARGRREVLLFVAGLATMTAAFMGLRVVH